MGRLEDLLQQLDEDQREAVTHGTGPLLVVAGAGSGKTRVLTYRIAWLLGRGLARPHEILAVTFTNKAAREMVERVEILLSGPLQGGFVGTFHRFALQLLRSHPREVDLPNRFAIADEDDQRRTLEGVLKRMGVGPSQLSTRTARARISAAKNALLAPDSVAGGHSGGLLAEVYAAYQAELAHAGAVDFDDMLTLAVRLLGEQEGIRKGLAARFRWLLVDEYQDTNLAQARLLWMLGGAKANLTVVGDEDQSIYRWRGAEVENILRFDTTYPGARVVTLGRNYRSVEPILHAAAAVIGNNRNRRPKPLTSEAGTGPPVIVYQAADEADEACWVAGEIERLRSQGEATAIAVLFRLNAQTRPFEAELVRRAIPYKVVGGVRFWERAEIKDAVAYLRLLVAPDDALAFRRAIHVPARGIGAATMEVLERAAAHGGVSLPAAARHLPEGLTPRARLALERFFALLSEVQSLAGNQSVARVVQAILERSGLADQYRGEEEEDRARRANLDQLVAAAAEAGERGLDLVGFLDEVALLSEADTVVESGAVQLSTLHAAKGLEFDAVFVTGLEDGLLPLRREETGEEDFEEERRLAYVGMTRARRRLALTAARLRRLHGQTVPCRPSPFLLEVPREVVDDRTAAFGRDPFRAHAPYPRRNGPPETANSRGLQREGEGAAQVRAAGAPRAGRRAETHPDGWRPGLKVRHPTFGQGVILQVQRGAAQTRLVVFFDRAGRKTLIPSIARLETS